MPDPVVGLRGEGDARQRMRQWLRPGSWVPFWVVLAVAWAYIAWEYLGG